MPGKNFFPISKGDTVILIILIIISLLIFLPFNQNITLYGMVLYGWLMAAFMLIAPLMTIIAYYLEKREKRKR